MIALRPRETRRLVAIHGWSGIVLGLLLYAVLLTGTVAVFAPEIGQWSAGTLETRSPFVQPIDAAFRRVMAATPARYRGEAMLFATTRNELGIFFHAPETTAGGAAVERGVAWRIDGTGHASRRDGTEDEVFGPDNDSALGRLLVTLHVGLHLPAPWGVLLTGVLGLAMLVAVVSGVLMHHQLLKDIFTLRRNAGPSLVARDRHNVAGTWSLPFAFVVSFTGSFLSLVGSFALPAVAMVVFGSQQRGIEKLADAPPAVDGRPAAAADLDRIVADAARRAGVEPNFITITHLGRADAAVATDHEPRAGGLATTSLVYSGATGEFRHEKPIIGATPSFGGSLYALMATLHFGNFAGVVSKSVWFGLGYATCTVVVTGMQLWLRRREAEQPSLHRLDRAVMVVGFGLPLALAGSALGFFLGRAAGSATYWTPATFVIVAAVAIAGGVVSRDAARLGRRLRLATGLVLIALPLVRLATGGPWAEALAAGQPLPLAVDAGVTLAGVACLWSLRRPRAPAPARATALQAAE